MLTDEEKRLVGGSDIAAVAGIHPKKGPLDVYRRIVEGYEPEPTPEEKKYFRRGLLLEPVNRAMYQDETGAELLGPQSLRHKRLTFLRASLDDIAKKTDKRVLELKSCNIHMAHQFGEGGDELPQHIICQTQLYMALSGIPIADVSVLIGYDLRIYTLTADKELIRMLFHIAEEFWRKHVVPKVPPPIDGSASWGSLLAERFPKASKETKRATEEVEKWASMYLAARSRITEAERYKEEAANNLKAFCGEAGKILGTFGTASWYDVTRKPEIDWEAVWTEVRSLLPADDQLALLARYNKQRAGYRAFRVTPAKNGAH